MLEDWVKDFRRSMMMLATIAYGAGLFVGVFLTWTVMK